MKEDGRALMVVVAGEPSGDRLGAGLLAALEALAPGRFVFAGVGGPAMTAAGLRTLFPLEELAVMGLLEVLPHARRLLRRLAETAAFIRSVRPAAVVTIDAPGFSFRLADRLDGRNFPLIHYVAPSVWAWRPARARRIARKLDHLLCLLPFEPPLFERHGLAASFVGHPAAQPPAGGLSQAEARARLGLAGEQVLAVLPGSRRGEIARLLPVFAGAVRRIGEGAPRMQVVLPTLPTLAANLRLGLGDWPVPVQLVTSEAEKGAAFAAADLALAASGTVAVELAAAGCPAVIAYRVNPITAAVVRRLIGVRFASLINLACGAEIQPEFLQERCRPDQIAAEAVRILRDAGRRARMVEQGMAAARRLAGEGEAPSLCAARAVLDTMAGWRGAPGRR